MIQTTFGRLCLLMALLATAQGLTDADNVYAATKPPSSYSSLIDWMASGASEDPLMALGDLKKGFSGDAHQANLAYFQNHPDLITTIKEQLDASAISWKLIDSKQRLLAVPEQRAVYADLFNAYCHEVVDYVIETTGGQNPYSAIVTLSEGILPDLATKDGITALLVHNLAQESAYTYAFHSAHQGAVAVELNQKQFIGELGAYSSSLITNDDGTFDFVPTRITIWQNTAANPYSVLMVPVEETLHILLRTATELAICADLSGHSHPQGAIDEIVEEWVAVEEAIAGGLVNQLLPSFLAQRLDGFQVAWIEDDLIQKDEMRRYRYLQEGIRVIEHLGVAQAFSLYQNNPNEFRILLQPLSD